MKISHPQAKATRALALFLALAVVASFTAFTPPAKAAGTVSVSASSYTVPAAGGTVTLTFNASGPSDYLFSVYMSSIPNLSGTEYPISLSPGYSSTSVTLTIPANTTQAAIQYNISFTATDVYDSTNPLVIPAVNIQQDGGVAVVNALTVNPTSYQVSNTVGQTTFTYNVSATAPGQVSVSCVSNVSWMTASTSPVTVSAPNTPTPGTVVLNIGNNTTGVSRSGTVTLTAGTYTAVVTINQGGPPTPVLSPSTDIPLNTNVTVTNMAASGQRVEVWTNANRTGSQLYNGSYSTFTVSSPTYITGATYYVFLVDAANNYSGYAAFTVRSGPPRPVVAPNQSRRAGETLTIELYSTGSQYVFYVGVNSNITSINNLYPATFNYYGGTTVTLPSSLPQIGYYYLYVYDTSTQQLSQASANSFYISDTGKPVRPEVTSGQRVKQGGTLRISSYNLSTAHEFVVKATNSNTYYASTTAGSQITNVTLPGTLAEGTYNLYVRSKATTGLTSVYSDPSANSFVVDNTAPRLDSTVPANNAAAVLPGTTFALTFNESMDTTKGNIAIRNTSTTGTQPTLGANPVWSNDNKTLTYTLNNLVSDATYNVTVYNADGTGYTGFRDAAGNLLNASSTITFKTGSSVTYSGTNALIPVAAALTTQNSVITAAVDATAFAAAATQAASEEGKGYKALITVTAELPANVNAAEATFPSTALTDMLSKTQSASLQIITGAAGTLTFNRDALSAVTAAGSGTVTLSLRKHTASTMTPQQAVEIGAEPAYEFTAKVGSFNMESFGTGTVTASVPYPSNTYMNANQVAGYKVSAAGVRTLAIGRYNQTSGVFEFNLKGFSTYTVRYSPKAYSDVTGWYTQAVEYTAARGLLDVFTTGNALEPTRTVTRAEFVTIFMKAYGIEPNAGASTVPFSDVYATSPYYAYLLKGKEMGLIQGGGGNMFNPDGLVTREEFFTLTYNMLTAMKRMPAASGNLTVYSFSDYNRISAFATAPIDALARAGVVQGSNGNITPNTQVNRGELAQLIYNLYMLILT